MKNKINKFYQLTKEIGIIQSINWLYLKKFHKSRYDSKLLKLLKEENLDIIKYYFSQNNTSLDKIKKTDYIWFFWWQGEKNMPPLVLKCYESLKKYSLEHEIIFLSKDNYKDYAELPKYILDLFIKGSCSITHFSDILRMNLLSNKGGIWVDATIYITDDFTKEIDNYQSMYTRRSKSKTNFISNGMWSTYFIATSKGHILSKALYEILLNYWKKHNFIIEYLLTDYIIYLLYMEIPAIKFEIDNIPYNNEYIHELESLLGDEFNIKNYNYICKKTYLHKLNWKLKYDKKVKGKITYYGYIMDEN